MNHPNIPPPFKRSSAADETKPSADAQNTAAPAAQTPASPAQALTGEALLQRLRYFENLVEKKDQYIAQLKAAVTRVGGAVPTAYFEPLSGEGGTYQPKHG